MAQRMATQRGISLIGLLFWAVVVGFTALVVIRVIPTVMEYYTIVKAVNRIAQSNPQTVAQARTDFDKTKQIEYSIVSVEPKDLEITKDNDKVRISFAYDKEVVLMGPVSLLIHYKGGSN